jgi:hypothetical protein
MQHRVQVGLGFYSVTVVQEAERDWYAFAEVDGEWLSASATSREEALGLWQTAAATKSG